MALQLVSVFVMCTCVCVCVCVIVFAGLCLFVCMGLGGLHFKLRLWEFSFGFVLS